jgi:hypothetical protein
VTAISSAVEGLADEAVARRLILHLGGEIGPVYGKAGKPALRNKLDGYVSAARWSPWLVIVDQDQDGLCPSELRREWVPNCPELLSFRVAVRAIEAWLLADDQGAAQFFGLSRARLPAAPDSLADPKQALLNLVQASRRRAIRDDMLPRVGSGRRVGPGYTSRLIEFASTRWAPDAAAERSESLRRAMASLRALTRIA